MPPTHIRWRASGTRNSAPVSRSSRKRDTDPTRFHTVPTIPPVRTVSRSHGHLRHLPPSVSTSGKATPSELTSTSKVTRAQPSGTRTLTRSRIETDHHRGTNVRAPESRRLRLTVKQFVTVHGFQSDGGLFLARYYGEAVTSVSQGCVNVSHSER